MTSNDGKSAREAENHRTSSEFVDAVALNLSRHYHPSQLRVDAWSMLPGSLAINTNATPIPPSWNNTYPSSLKC